MFVQGYKIEDSDSLLLQLHANWLPFFMNTGAAPTMLVLFKENKM